MKILLDENLPVNVNYDFGKEFEVETVKGMGWSGKKNGELLKLADLSNFAIFITLDKNLLFQQSINKYDIKFIILKAINNKPQTIQLFIPKIRKVLSQISISKICEIYLE